MTTLTDLYALRDMLDKATGPSREIDGLIYRLFYEPDLTGELCLNKAFSSSIDAAEALRQRLLPGWTVRVYEMAAALEWSCSVVRFTPPSHAQAVASNECLARLKATVAALIAVKEVSDEA